MLIFRSIFPHLKCIPRPGLETWAYLPMPGFNEACQGAWLSLPYIGNPPVTTRDLMGCSYDWSSMWKSNVFCLIMNRKEWKLNKQGTKQQICKPQKRLFFQWLWMISIVMYSFILPESFSVSRNLPREHSKGIKTEEFSALLRVLLLAAPIRCAQSGWPLGLGSLHYNRALVSRLKFQDRICSQSHKHLPVNDHFPGW